MVGWVSSFCLGKGLTGVVCREESGWKGLESKCCVERSSKKLEEKFGMPHCMHSHEVEVFARDFQTVGLIWTHFCGSTRDMYRIGSLPDLLYSWLSICRRGIWWMGVLGLSLYLLIGSGDRGSTCQVG